MTQQASYEPEDFDSWFANLVFNEGLMSLIHQIYEFDQYGKANNEPLIASLMISRRHKTVSDESLNRLSRLVSHDLIEDVIRARSNK